MRRAVLILASVAFLAAVATAIAAAAFPERIGLPDGYRPEGIAAKGKQLYVGSIPTGEVRVIDAKTGNIDPLVPARPGERNAIGLEVDNRRRLFVAGGPTGKAFVYDARTGGDLAQFQLGTPQNTFVNDVAVTRRGAYFTDSRRSVLYVVSSDLTSSRELPLPGVPVLPGINLNGIVATPDEKTLIAVQSNAGELWRIDPATGDAKRIDLGGADVANGDGLLLAGKRQLYVVQNRLNRIAVIRLSKTLSTGTVQELIESEDFDVPTTVARVGKRLYLPNARFRGASEPALPADAPYWITQVKR